MNLSDADALRRLYRFTIDNKASKQLVACMEAHIAVSPCYLLRRTSLNNRNDPPRSFPTLQMTP